MIPFKERVNRLNHEAKMQQERLLENHMRFYKTYLVGIRNCEEQLEYILPNITTKYGADNHGAFFM